MEIEQQRSQQTNTPDYWRLKGNDLFRAEAYKEALVCYEKALEINPNNSLAWNNRGSVFGKLGDYE